MKNLLLTLFALILSGLLFYLAFRTGAFNKSPARLEIITNPVSKVSLNGEEVGTSNYVSDQLKKGTYRVKLTPLDSSGGLLPYETILTLDKNDSAVINHTFATSSPDSSGYTLELQKQAGKEAYLSVVTDPDNSNLNIDSTSFGYSPKNHEEISPGSHQLLISSPGYKPITASVQTLPGHSLTVTAKLAIDTIVLSPPPTATATPTPSPEASSSPPPTSTLAPIKPYAVIEETGTGWLRVRALPSSVGQELGTATVGSTLPYLGETTDDGWHKVKFEGKTGWISAKYSRLVK